ncbi:DUF3040 domain-containing protein [Arthrobacter sp. CDRTa11]|uniref:DUF3040 domain-containing protein n=1 Tax=Arthrobacter sp. CDRTa11 TaxID=2651199 RepID=UPI002265EB80|nr:DUF3040 domain-containing protein [Arthrobacter sp. CDRTa11]UZX02140.1 DUF3040 domain-containing protein [Arthrobacter sp. CDRTa11]
MLLSPEERDQLDELERHLSTEDPELARTLRLGAYGQPLTADAAAPILIVLGGLLLLVVGIATKFIAVGVIGFLAMGAGVYWFVQKRWSENRSRHY